MRPGTKKGKLDRHPVWVVKIQMPKELIINIYSGYREQLDMVSEPATDVAPAVDQEMQPADEVMAEPGAEPMAAPAEPTPVEA